MHPRLVMGFSMLSLVMGFLARGIKLLYIAVAKGNFFVITEEKSTFL